MRANILSKMKSFWRALFDRGNPLLSSFRKTDRKKRLFAIGLLTSGFTVTIISAAILFSIIERGIKKDFEFMCSEIANRINARLKLNEELLRSQAVLFEVSDNITRTDWKRIYEHRQLNNYLPGIQGIGYQELVPYSDLKTHENKIRTEGFPNYYVRPSGEREIYTPIIFIEPFNSRNLKAFGYDTYSEPIRRKAMEIARDNNVVTLTQKLTLVQETKNNIQAGVIMFVPIYKRNMPAETLDQRRAAIQGWVSNPCRMDDLMNGILGSYKILKDKNIVLEIYDNEAKEKTGLLFDGKRLISNYIEEQSSAINYSSSISFNNQKWYLDFHQFLVGATKPDYGKVWLTLITGFIISILLFVIFLTLINTNIIASELAAGLTKELSESEAKYKIIFNNSIYAISLFDLETSKFIDVNETHCAMYGYSKEEFLSGITVTDISAEPEKSISSLHTAVEKGNIFIPLRYHRKKDGTIFPIELAGGIHTWRGNRVLFIVALDISKRKDAEEKIASLAVKYQSLMETSKDAIHVLDKNGNLIEANTSFYELLGYTRDEIAKLNVADWDIQWNKELLLEKINEIMVKPSVFETKHRHKNGEIREVEISGTGVELNGRTYLYAAARDITERKITEYKLLESERRWQFALEGAGDGVWDWDLQTNKVFYSNRWKQMIGYDENEIANDIDEWSKRVHPDDLELCYKDINRHINGDVPFYLNEHRMLCKNGEYKWILDRGKVISWTDDGKPLRMIGTHSDITERKKTEELLIRQAKELNNLNENLSREIEKQRDYELILQRTLEKEKDISALKSRIISTTSHEFRTPLANINASIDILKLYGSRWSQKKVDEQINKVKKFVKHLIKLLDDVLTVSKIENQSSIIKPELVDIADLAKECIDDINYLSTQKHKIELKYFAPIKEFLLDQVFIKYILINLLSNAVKFSPNGGKVALKINSTKHYLTIEVSDEGIGVSNKELKKIFEPFYRAKNAENIQGNGLGLGIVKHGVEMHRGKISVKSMTGKGTTFTIKIPLGKIGTVQS